MQKRGHRIEPIVEAFVAGLSAVEERLDVGDVVLVVAGVEQVSFLGLQQRRTLQPIDMALSDHDHALADIVDSGRPPEFDEFIELPSTVGPTQPIVRHDDDQDLRLGEAIVDLALELVAVADALAIDPDLRAGGAKVPQLCSQHFTEKSDEPFFVPGSAKLQVVVMRVGNEDRNLVAHRSCPLSLKGRRFPFPIKPTK